MTHAALKDALVCNKKACFTPTFKQNRGCGWKTLPLFVFRSFSQWKSRSTASTRNTVHPVNVKSRKRFHNRKKLEIWYLLPVCLLQVMKIYLTSCILGLRGLEEKNHRGFRGGKSNEADLFLLWRNTNAQCDKTFEAAVFACWKQTPVFFVIIVG